MLYSVRSLPCHPDPSHDRANLPESAGKFTSLASSLVIAPLTHGEQKCIAETCPVPPALGEMGLRQGDRSLTAACWCINASRLEPRRLYVCHDNCVYRTQWEIPFDAEPREVAALRRIMRLHLMRWGLPGVVASAQLCVSELVTNVIKHVGVGTPTTLTVSMNGTNLRLEVRDPAVDEIPTVLPDDVGAYGGRGLALVAAMATKWGVCLGSTEKTTWCELATGLTAPHGHVPDHRVVRADGLLEAYSVEGAVLPGSHESFVARATDRAVNLITDVLHWIQAHGLDPAAELERAQACFEAAAEV